MGIRGILPNKKPTAILHPKELSPKKLSSKKKQSSRTNLAFAYNIVHIFKNEGCDVKHIYLKLDDKPKRRKREICEKIK